MIRNYSSYELTMVGLPFATTLANHTHGRDKHMHMLSCKFMLYNNNNNNARQTEFAVPHCPHVFSQKISDFRLYIIKYTGTLLLLLI